MDYLKIITSIHKTQIQSLVTVKEFRKKSFLSKLPTKQRGLYWIWTKSSFKQLSNIVLSENKEVPISQLVQMRSDLNYSCKISSNGFTIVYNGIGGYKKTKSFGLRERILQEIKGNGPTVGTLNISKRANIDDWAISYFNLDDITNHSIISQLKSKQPYVDYAHHLELLWRIHYGIPILCRY